MVTCVLKQITEHCLISPLRSLKEFGLEIIALSYDLHHSEYDNPVQTEYEQKFSALGTPINFCEVVLT